MTGGCAKGLCAATPVTVSQAAGSATFPAASLRRYSRQPPVIGPNWKVLRRVFWFPAPKRHSEKETGIPFGERKGGVD